MRTVAIILSVAALACSQRIYAPPSQAFSLAPHHALPQGQQALDVEVSSHAQIFDPPVRAGAGRLRTGLGDNAEVSVEGTVMDVGTEHTTTTSIYAGRIALASNPEGGDATFFVGAGGGYAPAGGGFTALDGGLSLALENCVIVPVLQASAFVSQPLSARPIDVSTQDGEDRFETPARTHGGSLRFGLRVSLRPATCRRGEPTSWIYAGVGSTTVADHDSYDTLLGGGLGVTIPL